MWSWELSYVTSTCTSRAELTLLMGRKTWESIPSKFRLNLVLSSQFKEQQDSSGKAIFCQEFEDAVEKGKIQSPEAETVWVIGGHSLYKMALQSDHIHRIYLTRILKKLWSWCILSFLWHQWIQIGNRSLCRVLIWRIWDVLTLKSISYLSGNAEISFITSWKLLSLSHSVIT